MLFNNTWFKQIVRRTVWPACAGPDVSVGKLESEHRDPLIKYG